MRIINKKTLHDYWEKPANCRKGLEESYGLTLASNWRSSQEVKMAYPKASIITGNRVVFTIVGSDVRLIIKFAYKTRIGFVRFIGTHNEYDKVNAETVCKFMDKKNKIKIIKSKAQYSKYLAKIEALIESDPAPNSADGQLLEILAILIED